MIATLPSVQHNCKRARRLVCNSCRSKDHWGKRCANRRHRRALARAVRRMASDPERFWDEGFNAPSLSDWDLC